MFGLLSSLKGRLVSVQSFREVREVLSGERWGAYKLEKEQVAENLYLTLQQHSVF